MKTYAFDPKVIFCSRKVHKCYACLEDIPEGKMYICHAVKLPSGAVCSRKMCIVCSFLLSQSKGEIKPGGYTERMIPNFLRKIRDEFVKNPRAAIERIYGKCPE